jgi:hypothetical protein
MSSPVVTVRETERAIDLVRLLRSSPHNGFPVVDKQKKFKRLVRRKQIVALIECGILQSSSPDDGKSLDQTREPDFYRPKPGFGAFQSLMHWALYVKDDRYGEDLPNANAQEVGTLEDDESGENSLLLHAPKILKDVDRKFEPAQPPTSAKSFGKPVPRTSFCIPPLSTK